MGGPKAEITLVKTKKKRVFIVRFRICDWGGGGGRNLLGDQFWIGKGSKPQVIE